MSTGLRCVQSVLYWCHDKELYTSAQSTRSWAYGDEHLTLRFTLPPLPREVSGLRLSLQPCPISTTIQSVRFYGTGLANVWHQQDIKITSFGTLEARISPYAEPANADIKSSCATIKASPSVLRTINKGGILELVLSVSFADTSPALNNSNHEFILPAPKNASEKKTALTPAVARELKEMHNEVLTLNSVVNDFYRSNTWQWTMWCRESLANIRRWHFWKIYLLFARRAYGLINKPLKTVRHQTIIPRPTNIIVPVHNGLKQVERCLSAILESSSPINYQLIVVDDASSEKDVIEYLNQLADTGLITLVRNEINTGFTAAVNRGMQLSQDADVVLLNSDTIVSNNWLERLQKAAYSKRQIGTVTPFSNNASICTYPHESVAGEIPAGYDPQSMDLLFASTNDHDLVRIPTAVGFCMYIKRECLAQVGYFDAETFPGYGEENDFCMRAHKLGWWHVLAANTYVFHEGGSSYGDSQLERKRTAYDFLTKMYPEFQELVNDFVRLDPALSLRRKIDLKRLQMAPRPIILLVLHGQGGGTEKHVLDLVSHFGQNVDFLSLRVFGERAQLRWLNKGENFWQDFQMPTGYDELRDLLKRLPIQRIHVHHIIGLECIIENLIKDLALPFDFTAHDFYTVCPRGWLCDHRQHYCGQPDENGCNACLAAFPDPKAVEIKQWRKQYGWLVEDAQRVFIPSNDTLTRLKTYLPIANYIVTPHLENSPLIHLPPKSTRLRSGEALRVVVLGLLNAEKGSDLLDACAIDACKRNLPLEFHFLGAAHRPLSGRPRGSLLIYGRYQDIDIQELLKQVRPHLAWFPAQCPETYSYTLSACLEAALPIVAPDFGAFPERLAEREWSWIKSWQQTPEEWNDFLVKIVEEHFKSGIAPAPVANNKRISHFSYIRDYLQPTITNYSPQNLRPELCHSRS